MPQQDFDYSFALLYDLTDLFSIKELGRWGRMEMEDLVGRFGVRRSLPCCECQGL